MEKKLSKITDMTKRVSTEEVENDNILIKQLENFVDIFNSLSTVSFVLNQTRQVVFASNDYLKLMNLESSNAFFGFRHGEIISCIHSSETPDGCGTSDSCTYCGFHQAVLDCQKKAVKSQNEVRLSSKVNGKFIAWDFKVSVVPLMVKKKTYYVVTLNDISSDKRKINLEKIFLHDVINTASGVSGLTSMLSELPDGIQKNKIISTIENSSNLLLEQILSHRQLINAESGELELNYSNKESLEVLKTAIDIFGNDKKFSRKIFIDLNAENVVMSTDKIVLSRILVNMIKNALEANDLKEATVIVGCNKKSDKIRFWVQSEKLIPKNVQSQIFQRSFSSKGVGRGLGTYSMKLLGETYLKGKVDFRSNEKDKTLFYIDLAIS